MSDFLLLIVLHRLRNLNRKANKITATQADLANQLTTATAKVAKIGNETRTLLTLVQELRDAVATQPGVTPELQAAADALDVQVAVVDELVPDAPVEPPTA